MGGEEQQNRLIVWWMEKYLKIITMDGELVPLYMNIAQRKVHNTLCLQQDAGYPARAIILKARREGVSTYFAARYFMEANLKANRYACIVSADLTSSHKVFKMSKLFQTHIPDDIKRAVVASNRKEIVYSEPHRSEISVQTAGTDVLGRGGLTHYFHATEFAHWKDAKSQFGGAAQEIPDKPDTIIAIESTACGVGGAFYDIYVQAVEDWKKTQNLANYIPIFLPWFIFPDYQMKIPVGFKLDIGSADYDIPEEWVEPEKELVAKYGLCNEQLYWRRWAIKNKCQSDLKLFLQEFPATWREAFVASGRQVFLSSQLDNLEKGCFKGSFVLLEPSGKPSHISQYKNCWQIFKMPVAGAEYVIGIDTAESKQLDPDDAKSGFDFHGVQIFCRNSGDFVAEWHGQGSQRELGYQCLNAAKFYNDAWIAPELPCGMVTLDVLKESGYDRIYIRQKGDEQITELDTDNLGWRTTMLTRPKMIEDFRVAVGEGSMKIHSTILLDEMRSFVYDKEGRPRHLPGQHDDLLFAAMIALQLHLRIPMKSAPYPFGSTFEAVEAEKITNLARSGAIDNWESGDEEDFDEELTG